MKYRLLLLLWLAGLTVHAQVSADTTRPRLAGPAAHPDSTIQRRAFAFVDSVFNKPELTFEVDDIDIPADIQDILIRFNNAVAADKQWFADYRDRYVGTGKPLPYHEKFGITRQEYARITDMTQSSLRLKQISEQKVMVQRADGLLNFRGSGDAHILDYIQFDLKQRVVTFAGDTIPFIGEMNTPANTPVGLSHGYAWRYETADVATTLQVDQVTARVIEVNLLLPTQGNKVHLHFKYQDVDKGQPKGSLDLMGFFR